MVMNHEHPHAELSRQAYLQLRSAIDLLDATGAPGHIAAHADLARNLLGDLDEPRPASLRADVADLPYH